MTRMMTKEEAYRKALAEIRAVTAGEKDLIANLANISAVLKGAFPYYSWAGFYLLKEGELVLGPFQGKPACIRIKPGRGVCGRCAAEKKSLVVADVREFPGHIACDPDSRSEIVVPVLRGGQLKAVLDVDSAAVGSFDEADRRGLEEAAGIAAGFF
ncbi:MAG: GAF domain-containing protein [Elusimicrobia bacterium]|nr:GAF domain-containing protein [Elusimicrobiota bacterium]